jgi:hypothetical protein
MITYKALFPFNGKLFSYNILDGNAKFRDGVLSLEYSTKQFTYPVHGKLFSFDTKTNALHFALNVPLSHIAVWSADSRNVTTPKYFFGWDPTGLNDLKEIRIFWSLYHKMLKAAGKNVVTYLGFPRGTVLCSSMKLIEEIYKR